MIQHELTPEMVAGPKYDITEGLRARYDSVKLVPGDVHEITPLFSQQHEMAVCGNPFEGIDQHLRAVIKAGDEFFGIVDVISIDRSKDHKLVVQQTTALTRHLPNQRAELVGFIHPEGPQLKIGRNYQPGLSAKTSREHFAIAQFKDGYIGIVEPKETTNGTEVYTPSIHAKQDVSKRLLHMDTADPAGDFDFWSVKSADLNAYLNIEEANKKS